MIFDRLCRLIERNPDLFQPLRGIVEQARLFHFPHNPGEVLPKNYDQEALDFHEEHFVLPFRTVAIEDESSVVLLWDAVENAQGTRARRLYLELAPLGWKHASTWHDADEEKAWRDQLDRSALEALEHSYQLTFGAIWNLGPSATGQEADNPEGRWRYSLECTLAGVWVLVKDAIDIEWSQRMHEEHGDPICYQGARNAVCAIEEFMQFNAPDRFILEQRPTRERKKAAKILRSGDRPTYTLLHPSEIRSKLRLPEPEQGGPRKPHERRRHVRRYPDDVERWPNMHGKSIVIPASWVGPSEATVGKQRYKVLLDR